MVFEEIGIWVFALGIVAMFALLEWVRWFLDVPPHPYLSSGIFLLLGVFVVGHVKRVTSKLRNYDLGLIGERYVAERLGELRAEGYHIIHDIPCGRMNIDHILVGPAGVFTVETKMARKEVDRVNEITHTDSGVLMNGKGGWCGKALWEAGKEADYLREILTKDSGACPHIQPIIVYPGWFVKDDCSRKVWVLNDRYLLKKIRSLSLVLSPENVQRIRLKIEAYARQKAAEADYKS